MQVKFVDFVFIILGQDYIPLGTFAVLAGVGIIGFSSLGFLTVITVDIKPVLQIVSHYTSWLIFPNFLDFIDPQAILL